MSHGLEEFPAVYWHIMRRRLRNTEFRDRLVDPLSDLVIDGFPRTASSFAVRAFHQANGTSDYKIATHIHSPAQILLGERLRIPMILTIRNPRDAVVAWMTYADHFHRLDSNGSVRYRRLWLQAQTWRFAKFYEATNRIPHAYVLSDFDKTTTEFSAVMAQLNDKFGCHFELFDHSAANVRAIFDSSKEHLSPNELRNTNREFYEDLYDDTSNKKYSLRATAAYEKAVSLAS